MLCVISIKQIQIKSIKMICNHWKWALQKKQRKIKVKEGYNPQYGALIHLCQLKDGRIIVLGEEDTFTVLNPSQNYKTDLQIKLSCTKVCQLENGLILTVGNDVTLWQLTQNELKKEFTIDF